MLILSVNIIQLNIHVYGNNRGVPAVLLLQTCARYIVVANIFYVEKLTVPCRENNSILINDTGSPVIQTTREYLSKILKTEAIQINR
jgi:hypothetical protein